MSDHLEPLPPRADISPNFFAPATQQPSSRSGRLIALTAVIVGAAIVAALLMLRGHQHSASSAQNLPLPVDPYAAKLAISQLAMSQSTSLSGATSTFIDGHVKNSGDDIITSATLQVFFRNDVAMPPDIEKLPLSLIRTHEPYIDTQPVSAAPLKPGDEQEFRLVIEAMPTNWNQQMPEIQVIHVSKK